MEIVFENELILIVNKPAGLVVNKSQTMLGETLQDMVAKYLMLKKDDLGIGQRAGIVHRLDRETSGLLLIAKTQRAFEKLQEQFKNRLVTKKYIALVHGVIPEEKLTIENAIIRIGKFGRFGIAGRRQAGKEALTEAVVVSNYRFSITNFQKIVEGGEYNKVRQRYLEKNAVDYTLLDVFPKTGRTHQIRVHLKSIGHPVVSDLIYAPNKLLKFDLAWCNRLFLHAAAISFKDPGSGKTIELAVDLPNDLKNAMLFLKPKA